jgi:phosphoribosylformylglycinamidine cyclo-ligase
MAKLTYRDAGVDIDEGDRLVELIKPHAASTKRPGVMGGLGGFGGLFALTPGRYREPVLVSGTDGVGTKLKVAFAAGRHGTVGIDLVAMSVNDVCVTGAEPLFFLDYYATSRLKAEEAAEVVAGIAEGCRQAGCALLGGETAELPGFYAPGEYDLAGFAVGIVERSEIIDGSKVAVGDAVLGLASTGLHSNGYSLARKVLLEGGSPLALAEVPPELGGRTLADVLLEPTRIYARAIASLRAAADVRALAHITGGGLPGNVPRVLPVGTRAQLHLAAWPLPPIFDLIRRRGELDEAEMYRTLNMGIGLCAVVPAADAAKALAALDGLGQAAYRIGTIVPGTHPGAEADVTLEPGPPPAVTK